ncbi:TPA: hypothetical protein HA235_02895 [Candidatus Woesearchaeota archaeon]|nr:hypothetical protein [Candidatus Woesearchaeota archaeon]HIJ14059.1 hypothetical protein [Candidatus Woesearchaeota archaeon]
MRVRDVILDFDGNLTDTIKEADPCISYWHQLFCERTNTPPSYLLYEFEKMKKEILSDPKAGWVNNGFIVAQATADPYVLTTTIYQHIIRKFGDNDLHRNNTGFHIPSDQKSRDEMLTKIFLESYTHSSIMFRPGAKQFLDELIGKYGVAIVTNSKTDSVEKKLKTLADYSIPIIGNAKKYVIDQTMDNVPESVNLEGFPRPVLLRRRNYKEILDKFDPEKTVVVGDIYELDLALPEFLGFKVIQMATDNTPEYEIEYHKTKPNNLYAQNYDEILKNLEKY